MKRGFVKIPNRFFEERWWNQVRTFSETEAMIDIYQSTGKDGMFETTLRTLSERWKWDKMRISRFLSRLADFGYIYMSSDSSRTRLQICDFGDGKIIENHIPKKDEIQNETASETLNETASETLNVLKDSKLSISSETASETLNETASETDSRVYMNDNINISMSNTINNKEEYKEKKKEIKEKEINKRTATIVATNLDERKKAFYNSLIPYVEKYGRDMVRDFYEYWSEGNRSQTKMRFELEKTWEVGRRLGYWHRRSNNGNNRTSYSREQQRRNDTLQRMQDYESVAAAFRQEAFADLALRGQK